MLLGKKLLGMSTFVSAGQRKIVKKNPRHRNINSFRDQRPCTRDAVGYFAEN